MVKEEMLISNQFLSTRSLLLPLEYIYINIHV